MITKIKPISCRIVNGATPLSMLPGLMYLKLEKSEKLQTIEYNLVSLKLNFNVFPYFQLKFQEFFRQSNRP